MLDTEKIIFGKILYPVLKLCCILNIHPNVITLSSFISSFLMLKFHKNHQFKYLMYMIIYKWLSDGLDGEVARKCKKTSVIGGILDLISDEFFYMVLFKILLSFFIKNDDILWVVIIIASKIYESIYVYNYGFDAIHNHDIPKRNSNNIFEKIFSFYINNCLIGYILTIYLYYYLSHKK